MNFSALCAMETLHEIARAEPDDAKRIVARRHLRMLCMSQRDAMFAEVA